MNNNHAKLLAQLAEVWARLEDTRKAQLDLAYERERLTELLDSLMTKIVALGLQNQ